jgi:superfamily II DNA or RNA helicase
MIELINNSSIDEQLRDYQLENKLKIYNLWIDNQSVMLQMPTGTGKTRLFASIVKDIHNLGIQNKKAYKVLILAHRQELIKQISENIGVRYGIAHGKIMSKNWEEEFYPTQVASIQTLVRRLNKWEYKNFDFIIIDEAHHALATTYIKICDTFPDAKILGVTATPYRLGKGSLKKIFETLIVSYSISHFIKNGYLSEYEYYSVRPNSKIQNLIDDINEFDFDGDYAEKALSNTFDKEKIRANLLETYFKYASGRKGIIYTINKKHNEHVCKMFNDAGIVTSAIDSDTNTDERNKIVRDFKNGNIQILCNVNIFSEGFDCPDVEFIQLARPTKSLSMYLQQVGRGFRIHEEKDKVIFLDNVGLYNRFGLPSANRMWQHHFDGKKTGEDEYKPSFKNNDEISFIEIEPDIEEGNEKIELIFRTNTNNEKIDLNAFDRIEDFDLYLYDRESLNLNDLTSNQDKNLDNILSILKFQDNNKYKYLLNEFDDSFQDISWFKKITHFKKIINNNKVGLWDSFDSKIILEPIFEEIIFLDIFGRILISKNNKKGVYNVVLKLIEIDCKYDEIIEVDYQPNYFIVINSNKYGIVSYSNNFNFEPIADNIIVYKNLFNIRIDNKWEVYDSNFEIISFEEFRKIDEFSNYELVEYHDIFGIYYDKRIICPFIIIQFDIVLNNRIILDFGEDGLCVFNDNLEYVIKPNNYSQIELLNEVFFKVSKNSKWGIFNIDGKNIIDINYTFCELIDNMFFITYKKQWNAIDLNGKIIISSKKKKTVINKAKNFNSNLESLNKAQIKNKVNSNFSKYDFNKSIYMECLSIYDFENKAIRINKVLREFNTNFKSICELFERINIESNIKNPNSKISIAEYQYIKKSLGIK